MLLLLLATAVYAQNYENSRAVESVDGEPADLLAAITTPPLGLPAMALPRRNPPTEAKIALGRKLFFDRRLSFNRTLSCAMCHVPEQGFTQYELKTPVGIEGRFVKRNSPTLLNVGYRTTLFHDGREATLENQVWQPLLKSNEMANPSIGFVLATIRDARDYEGLFEAAFDQGLTAETVGMALASYQRGLVAADSPFQTIGQALEGRPAIDNVYGRVVSEDGNRHAHDLVDRYFEPSEATAGPCRRPPSAAGRCSETAAA